MTTTTTANPVTENAFAILQHVAGALADRFTTLYGHSPAAIATQMPIDADTCGPALSALLTTYRDPRAGQSTALDLDESVRADLIDDLAEVALCVLAGIAYLDGDLATALTDQAARALDLIDLSTPEGR